MTENLTLPHTRSTFASLDDLNRLAHYLHSLGVTRRADLISAVREYADRHNLRAPITLISSVCDFASVEVAS